MQWTVDEALTVRFDIVEPQFKVAHCASSPPRSRSRWEEEPARSAGWSVSRLWNCSVLRDASDASDATRARVTFHRTWLEHGWTFSSACIRMFQKRQTKVLTTLVVVPSHHRILLAKVQYYY